MGRIADAALALLADGPAMPTEIGEALARQGITRARSPAAAVRRALRGDPRIAALADGRLVSLGQALDGVVLTVLVTEEDVAAGRLFLEPDLAPFVPAGLGPTAPVPAGARPGMRFRVAIDLAGRRLLFRPAPDARRRPADERDLVRAAESSILAVARGAGPARLADAGLAVMAARPDAFRRPGRTLSEVLQDAGFEVRMGWVGLPGTAWDEIADDEAALLEIEVDELLWAQRLDEAAALQRRLVGFLEREIPVEVPPARRRLASILRRAGRAEEALEQLRRQLALDDPEDRYEAALVGLATQDLPLARRMAEDGLARATEREHRDVAACLNDLAGDLDAQAHAARLHESLSRTAPLAAVPRRIAEAIVGPRRSYLVETMVETLFESLDEDEAEVLIDALGRDAGRTGREACLACSAVLPEPLASRARRAARGARAAHSAVAGLLGARPVAAWSTSEEDAPDQQQLVVAVGKEAGRIAPLVALLDRSAAGPLLRDAFFLPDMARERLEREIFVPMADMGLPPWEIPLDAALALLARGLERAEEQGRRLPSHEVQPVAERIRRLVLGARIQEGGRPAPHRQED
jgi:hypothetical protein